MNCKRCGQTLDSNAQICPFCGESTYAANKKENAIFEECARSLSTSQNDESEPEVKYTRKNRGESGRRQRMRESQLETAATESTPPETKYKKSKRWNPGPLIAGILVTIALLGAAAFAAYYAYNHFMGESSTQYVESLQTLNEQIEKANGDFVNVLTSSQEQLPVSEILKQIPKTYDSFDDLIEGYNDIVIPSVHSESNKKLGEAINLNKSIYQDINNILKNPADPQTEQNLNQLSKDIDQCMELYTSIGIDDVRFSLPNEVISISSKLKPWASKKQAEYAQVTALIGEFTKYFDNMINIFLMYDKTKYDFNTAVKNIRGGTGVWDDLFIQLDISENLLKETQADYTKLSVPSELKSLNKGFAPILDESLLYISKFRFAAQAERDFTEETQTTEGASTEPVPGQITTEPTPGGIQNSLTPEQIALKKAEIDALYQDAAANNANAALSYQKYAAELNNAKTNYLDPEYVLNLKTKK